MNILLFGPQGCGKGTQAGLLVKKYHLKHISPGELFRTEVAKDSKLGKQLKDYMDRGVLVPKDINFRIVKEALEKVNFTDFILDGFPRNTEQAEFLKGVVKIDFAIEINISDDEAVKRISARYSCQDCGEGFNTIYIKPKKPGICDKCGGRLIQRDDDKPEAVRKRLQIYHEQTEQLKEFYKKKKIFFEVNGERPIADVFEQLKKIISP